MEKQLKELAYKTLLSTFEFYELWQIYKGIKKMAQEGYPIVIDENIIITDQQDAILFFKILVNELELRLKNDNNKQNNKKDKPNNLTDNENNLESVDLPL